MIKTAALKYLILISSPENRLNELNVQGQRRLDFRITARLSLLVYKSPCGKIYRRLCIIVIGDNSCRQIRDTLLP